MSDKDSRGEESVGHRIRGYRESIAALTEERDEAVKQWEYVVKNKRRTEDEIALLRAERIKDRAEISRARRDWRYEKKWHEETRAEVERLRERVLQIAEDHIITVCDDDRQLGASDKADDILADLRAALADKGES